MQGPATIDLFSGAGGPSQGFAQAGFDVRLRVDLDAAAIETYRHNIVGAVGVAESVENVTGRDLLQAAGLESVDVVIGGPSCQGFNTHDRRSGWVREDDPRNYLYKHYARLLSDLNPSIFVMENVPGRGRTVPSVLSVAVEATTRATSAVSEARREHRDHPRMLHGLAGPAADWVGPDGELALIRRGRNPQPRVGPALDGHPAA